METKVIRVGVFAFEGFGPPFEGWVGPGDGHDGWIVAGRAWTRRGAAKKARLRAGEVRTSVQAGDSIVTRARAAGFGAGLPTDEGAMTVDGPPFKHDYRKAPLMIDVSDVRCEHPDCDELARPTLRYITPFGEPLVCRKHAIELMVAYMLSDATPEELQAVRWVLDAMRHGPKRKGDRLEWIASGRPRETMAEILDWPAGRRDARL